MYDVWYEYLNLINLMASNPGMYGLDIRRSELHDKLTKYYSEIHPKFNKERFNEICHNLDKVIGFKPPLGKTDHIKPYANHISTSMGLKEARLYVIEHIDRKPYFY